MGWIVYFVVIYITFLTIAQPGNFLYLFFLKGFRALTGFLLTSLFLRPIYHRFGTRVSIAGLVLMVLVCAALFGAVWTAIEAGFIYFTNATFDIAGYLTRGPRIALDYAMTLAAWSAFYLGVKNWWSWQNERENALQSAALANKAQLEMLRYQLNPHFLFNALNSVRASIDEDSARAKKMITQLSEFLRYSLLNESSRKIPLRVELEAVRNYLEIEKTRFEDKLVVDFTIENDAENFNVPCFILNPLVENAVKHGLQTSPKPLSISIYAETFGPKLVLEVSNSGTLKYDPNGSGTKIGLKNVSERLEKAYGESGGLELKQEGDLVKARIEIIDEVQNNNR
ncbi:MAG TPA: histidine kinase [Pyrinomonadaceae bacterium]|nr:histidine kinase [Pyrinomonadaceae bacterium]